MTKYCFFPHPSSLNHGCEAIAVASHDILKKHMNDFETALLVKYPQSSDRRGGDLAYNLFDHEINVALPTIKRYSITWIKNAFYSTINIDKTVSLLCADIKKKYYSILNAYDVFVSIGGDNYCYGRPVSFYALNRAIHDYGKKSILWGCSIEPSAITDEMLDDLRLYDTIVTRESITYDALCAKGLTNAKLYPDPAFTLSPLFQEKVKENTVGINISPMILDYSKDSRKVLNAYKKMIEYIIDNTNYNIAFVPHVTASTTDDRSALGELYNSIGNKERITVYDDMDCQKLKSIIAQCRFFVGARTHATIAAYSSCVPTLVCGYSVKAKGIAKDLFGSYENYVVPVQDLQSEDVLTTAFIWMEKNEIGIRNHLSNIMPEYIEKAWAAGKELSNVIE